MSAHLLGYARVSTTAQDLALQHDALTAAGCYRVWTDTASGALTARPALDDVLERLGRGGVLVVWRLDRLARSAPCVTCCSSSTSSPAGEWASAR